MQEGPAAKIAAGRRAPRGAAMKARHPASPHSGRSSDQSRPRARSIAADPARGSACARSRPGERAGLGQCGAQMRQRCGRHGARDRASNSVTRRVTVSCSPATKRVSSGISMPSACQPGAHVVLVQQSRQQPRVDVARVARRRPRIAGRWHGGRW